MNIRQPYFHANLFFFSRLILVGLVLVNLVSFPRAAQASSQGNDRDPIWNAKTNDAPAYLRMTTDPHNLYSEYQLPTLAGHLINFGVVDASGCGWGGLISSNKANDCGVQRSTFAAAIWQNRFNVDIVMASQQTGVPPILMKNIFVYESQFWPQTMFIHTFEFGLGHMTQMGADSLLRWNYPFYESFCKAQLSADRCQQVYVEQPADVQALLQGLVLQQVDADCSGCTYSLDLTRAQKSIPFFANTLIANANLVKHYIKLYTGEDASSEAGYQDLWDFALTSYNAGPGCFRDALLQTVYANADLTWKNLSSKLEPGCKGAISYVTFVSKTDSYHPNDDPSILPTAAPTLSAPTLAATAPNPASTLPVTETVSGTTPTSTVPAAETSATPVSNTPTLPPTAAGEPALGSQTPAPTSTDEISSGSQTPAPTPTSALLIGSDTPAPTSTDEISSGSQTPAPTPTSTLLTGSETPAPTSTSSLPTSSDTPAPTPTSASTTGSETPAPTSRGSAPTGSATPAPTNTLPVTATPTAPAAPEIPISRVLQPLHVGNELVIKIDPKQRDAVLQNLVTLNMSLAPSAEQIQSLDTLVARVNPDDIKTALTQLRGSAGVEFVEPNYLVLASGLPADASQPDDPLFTYQNYLQSIQVPQAWDALPTLQPVTVAVLDTGVNITHPDLVNSIWVNAAEAAGTPNVDDDNNGYVDDLHGWNFVDNNNNVNDDNGHGTHLAGIIAASINNAVGIAGIAPNARIMPVKVLDKSGYGSYADVAEGIIYATDRGARIIELGFSGTGSSNLMQNAINYALAHNVLIVAAAGNSGHTTTYYPAAYTGVLAVSALDNNKTLASFSTSGNDVSLSAPGVGIISTGLGVTYPYMSGSSMASAEVAGVAALLAGGPTYADTSVLRSALLGSALDLGAPGPDPQYGYGMIQALSALDYAGQGVPTSTPELTPTPGAGGGSVHTASITTEQLYGTAQECNFGGVPGNISSPLLSIDDEINGNYASCTGAYASTGSSLGSWTYTSMQPITSLQTIAPGGVTLYIAFSTSGVSSTDSIELDVSNDGGNTWHQVTPQPYTSDQSLLSTLSYNVSQYFTTVAQVNQAQVRFNGVANPQSQGSSITINLDEARLDVEGYAPPIVSITAPADNSTYAYGADITFTGTAADPQEGDISSSIVWYSDLTGPFGTGATVSISTLLSGTHTIYAQATDSGSASGISAPITIKVKNPTDSPHGNFTANTDECALCHRDHTAQGSTYLTNNPNSVLISDAFCLSCHKDVSTHSNYDFSGAEEPQFQIRCIQCHDPHGSSNLFDVRTSIITNLTTNATTGPVIFTALSGTNSFDDGGSTNRLCTVCHTSVPSSPGSYVHSSGVTYAGQSCVACHPHNADTDPNTLDGFMPVLNTLPIPPFLTPTP
ncbi:MAG TPA: S8 family serine peptidase [Anaerolineales bacterium]|nr:S8 family serine peptidase [Anaerolineales bacterium]